MTTRILYLRAPAPTWIVPPPGTRPFIGYDELPFVGWDRANPRHTVACVGLNPRQAQDDAALKLGVCVSRVAVRRAPVDRLPSAELA